MGFFKGLSKTYLIFINVILGLLGLGLACGAGYALSNFSSEFDNMFTKKGLYFGIVGGVITFFISFMGWYGAAKQKKCLLGVYTVIVVLMTIIYVLSGLFVSSYIGNADVQELVGKELAKEFTDEIRAFELLSYNKCCYDVFSAEYTSMVKSKPCNGTYTESCYNSQFNYKITKDICTAFKKIEYHNVPIVSKPTDRYGCGGGSPSQFTQNVYGFIDTNLKTIKIVAIVVAVIQLLAIVFSICLICSNREHYDEEYAKQLEQDRQGGSLTGTSNPQTSLKGSDYV